MPSGDAKAEKFADMLYARVHLKENDILAVADLPPIENTAIAVLQEILCKLSSPFLETSNLSPSLLSSSAPIPPSRLLSLPLPHRQ